MPGVVWDIGTCRSAAQLAVNNLLETNDLTQVVQEGTRISTVSNKLNLLDVILLKSNMKYSNCDVVDGLGDHKAVFLNLHCNNKPKDNVSPRLVRQYKKADRKGIEKFLRDEFPKWTSSNTEDIEDIWNSFKKLMNTCQEKFIPSKLITKNSDPQYFTRAIRVLKRKCQKAYTTRRYNGIHFKKLSDELLNKKQTAYSNYLKQILETKYEGERKWDRFYKHIKNKQGTGSKIPVLRKEGVCVTEDVDIANMLNMQYASVYGDKSDANQPATTLIADGWDTFTFSNESIARVIDRLSNKKSPGADGITNDFIKMAKKEIVPYLRCIFQMSINNCQMPVDWKFANITPIPKGGKKDQADNYRPISLTSAICKIFETLIAMYIRYNLEKCNWFTQAQHGFRGGHSCESQLTGFIQEISDLVDNHGEVDAILLDFSKAFDKVSHGILVQKLSILGMDERVLGWIREWLTDRKQVVKVGEAISNQLTVTSGVPQGSVLGPLLFIIFINDIITDLTCKLRLFADDCIVYSEIRNNADTQILQDNLCKICSWVKVNNMELNEKKSQLITFTTKRTIRKCNYEVNSVPLNPVDNCKYLGIILNSKLTWKKQVENVIKKGMKRLHFVMRNLRGSNVEAKEMAYKSIVRPLMEYGSVVWDPAQQELKHSVEMIQRRAVRKVLSKYGRRYSPTDMLEELKWESLECRRKTAKLATLYKITAGKEAWAELADGLAAAPLIGGRRNNHGRKIAMKSYNTNVGKFSFVGSTVPCWNKLNSNILNPWPATVQDFKNRMLEVL
jgi:hypothetical protein